ncbi:MAG: hypothetical protein HY393_03305 [Candidatus Diapherotrites archaeon]|nr:hypothetical protein [Candidatus Diapherotrites archaeon]
MGESMAISKVYDEIKALRRDLLEVKYALIPLEKVSAKKRKELDRIFHEMERGEEKSFYDILSK